MKRHSPFPDIYRHAFIDASFRFKRRVDGAETTRRLGSNDASIEPRPCNVRMCTCMRVYINMVLGLLLA